MMWLPIAFFVCSQAAAAPLALSLPEAITRAEKHDARFTLSHAEAEDAAWQAHESWSGILPTATAGATLTRNAKEIRVGEGDAARVVSPLWQPQGTLATRLTVFQGERIFATLAAYADAEGAALAEQEARDGLRADVAVLYLALAEGLAQLDAYARAESTAKELVRIAKARIAAGDALELDLEEARVELLRATAERAVAQGQTDEVQTLLALRIGAPIGTRLAAACDACVVPPPSAGTAPEGANALAWQLENRSDLHGLGAIRRASELREIGGWLSWLPSVDVVGNVRLAEPTLFNPEPIFWNAQVQLSWQLFSGTARLWSNLRAHNQAERLSLQEQVARDEAEVEVRQAEISLRAAERSADAAVARAAAARRALQLAEVRYREGLSSALDTTEVARRHADADLAAVRARFAVYGATLRLRRAMGLSPIGGGE